jgi:hypothetical protein
MTKIDEQGWANGFRNGQVVTGFILIQPTIM